MMSEGSYLAIIACNRVDLLENTLKGLVANIGTENFHTRIFLDLPDNHQDIDLNSLQTEIYRVIAKFNLPAKFKSLKIIRLECNHGIWKMKLNAFQNLFSEGAELVLLLEDDVFLYPDALSFVSKAYRASRHLDCISTISLYSNNLIAYQDVTFNKANDYLIHNPKAYHSFGIRNWPFPWGIALSKQSFEKLIEYKWNGNDQKMGEILNKSNGIDIFPIISRSEHCGPSKFGNFKIYNHEIIANEIFMEDGINIPEPLDQKKARDDADFYFLNLKNDQQINASKIKLLTDSIEFSKYFQEEAKKYSYIQIKIILLHDESPDNIEETLASIIPRDFELLLVRINSLFLRSIVITYQESNFIEIDENYSFTNIIDFFKNNEQLLFK